MDKQIDNKNQIALHQVHLSDYISILKRRKWVVIFFFLIIVGSTALFSFMSEPVYEATAQVLIEKDSRPVINLGDTTVIPRMGPEYYQTQYNILMSRSLAKEVIDRLSLWSVLQQQQQSRSPGVLSNIATFIGGLLGKNTSEAGNITTGPSEEAQKNLIIDWYLRHLRITPVRGSQLIKIGFQSSSPELSAQVANAHAEAYIQRGIENQHATYNQALQWLRNELRQQKAKLKASRNAIHNYKKQNNILTIRERDDIVSQKLVELNSALTKAKADRIAKEAVYNQLKNFSIKDESIFSLPEVSNDPVIQNLRNQLITLKAKRFEMATRYGPKHPRMKEISHGISQLEQELKKEVKRLSRTIKASLDRAIALERSIQRDLEAQKQVVLKLNEKNITNEVLQREAEVNQNLYDILLRQYSEISLKNAMKSSKIQVVDRAEVPLIPVKPRIFLNILLSIVLSMFMGPGFAFFFEYMDKTVKTPDDVYQRLGMPVLGLLPYKRSLKINRTKALAWDEPEKQLNGGYNSDDISSSLVTNLHLTNHQLQGKTLFVESAGADEGKSTVLAKAAINLATGGLRVLMIDADHEKSSLPEMFGLKQDSRGLLDIMNDVMGKQPKEGTLRDFSIDDLFFLVEINKLSGRLTVRSESQEMTVLFSNGRLIHIQSKDTPLANRLGNMLLKGGFITEGQLKVALERNNRTGQPLGYILINSGYITPEKLRGPLKLQMEEHLQKLFSWKQGTFVFQLGDVQTYDDERLYFYEDYTPIIQRLGRLGGSRFIEGSLFSGIATLNSKLHLMPSGRRDKALAGTAYLMLLDKFLDILKRRFDIILVDLPPVLEMPAVASLSTLADGVVFVVKAGHLSVKAINKATSTLRDAHVNIIGAILNQVKIGKDYYYYQ